MLMPMQRTNAFGMYHQGSPVRCDAKARKEPAIYVQATGSFSFFFLSRVHNFSEEDCRADRWEKPVENLVALHQMPFASVNHTLSASVCLRMVITRPSSMDF